MSLPEHFGGVVRQLRESQRWSQELLAHKADINRSFLGEIERGTAVPTLATMDKLSRALNVRLSELVSQCESSAEPTAAPEASTHR